MSDRRNYEDSDRPPHSRLFIVSGKESLEENLDLFKEEFTKYGPIEDMRVPRDRNTNEVKGVIYIKYTKTSHAADAVEDMHMRKLPNMSRPLKVMVASSRSSERSDINCENIKRLFITVPKNSTEDEIDEYFGTFGEISSVNLQRDRNTGESRGFAYVCFNKFSDAARAFEGADRKYRAIFAAPKGEKRSGSAFESNLNALATSAHNDSGMFAVMDVQPEGYTRVNAICSPFVPKQYVEQLFDIVPGMIDFQYTRELLHGSPKLYVSYSNAMSAAYAVKKLHNFEYPPGERILVKPDFSNTRNRLSLKEGIPRVINTLNAAVNTASTSSTPDLKELVDAIAKASNLIKAATSDADMENKIESTDWNYCSVPLPSPKPLAHINSKIVKRCFLVCQPSPPPLSVLRDIFCRFGDLINVYTIPNKTVGYACYASAAGADAAISTLHGADICGIRTKVLEAEDRREYDHPDKRTRHQ